MKRFPFLFLLLLYVPILHAQVIIPIEADFISDDSQGNLQFIKKEKNRNYSISHIRVQHSHDKDFHISTTTRTATTFTKKNSFKSNLLSNLSPEKFINTYLQKEFYGDFQTEEDKIQILNAPVNSLLQLNTYEKTTKKSEWKLKNSTFLNYFFVVVNKKKTLVVFINNSHPTTSIGYFLIKEKNPVLSLYNPQSRKSLSFSSRSTLPEIQTEIFPESPDFWAKAKYNITTTMVRDLISQKPLLSKEYDSVVPYKNFLIGYDKNKSEILNRKLEVISPSEMKYFHLNTHSQNYSEIQILYGNSVAWLTSSGLLLDSPTPNYIAICGTGLMTPRSLQFHITHDADFFYLNNRKLASTSKYNHITFLDGSTDFNGYSSVFKNKLKVQKGENFGLIEIIEPTDTALETYVIQEILPVEYQEIVQEDEFLKIKKNNLWGFLEMSPIPKYQELERFQDYFARFTLANGTKGWLTRDGKEFIDD